VLYRLREAIRNRQFDFRTRVIRDTPPIPCDPRAACEIHTMLSEAHVPMYLVAVKSLLRFHDGLSVVIHSDGTLKACSERRVMEHVPGCRIIPADQADARAGRELGPDSMLRRWRGNDAAYRRLIDTELWGQTAKRIILDADVIVLRRPDELIDWIDRGDRPFVMGQPPAPVSHTGSQVKPGHMQSAFVSAVPRLNATLDNSSEFLDGGTGGLYGCAGGELSLQKIERVLRACLELQLPMQQWGAEQCMIVYLLGAAGAKRLDPARYFNFSPSYESRLRDAALVHFFGTHRHHKGLYRRLAANLIDQMAHEKERVPA
jgi:hypothetical protein